MIGLINQCGRQIVVIVCEKYPRGVGLCRSRWGAGPKRSFPTSCRVSISRNPRATLRLPTWQTKNHDLNLPVVAFGSIPASHRATQSAGAPPDVDTTDDDGTRGVHPHREHAPRRARRRAILRRIEPRPRQQRRPSSPELTIGVRHLPGGRARRRGSQTRRRASLRGAPARRARVAPHLPSQRAHRAPRTRIALLRRPVAVVHKGRTLCPC